MTQRRAAGMSRDRGYDDALPLRRRTIAPTDISPVPRRKRVPGSGTVVKVIDTFWPGRKQLWPSSGDNFVHSVELIVKLCPFVSVIVNGPLPLPKES